MAEDIFFTTQDVADRLQVNTITIQRYIKLGKLKAYKFGKEFRISQRSFDDFLEEARFENECRQ